jgi:hypothetical protein
MEAATPLFRHRPVNSEFPLSVFQKKERSVNVFPESAPGFVGGFCIKGEAGSAQFHFFITFQFW